MQSALNSSGMLAFRERFACLLVFFAATSLLLMGGYFPGLVVTGQSWVNPSFGIAISL